MVRDSSDFWFQYLNDDENVREGNVEKNGLNVEVEARLKQTEPSASEAFTCHETALE